jgi:hypothetical protein
MRTGIPTFFPDLLENTSKVLPLSVIVIKVLLIFFFFFGQTRV